MGAKISTLFVPISAYQSHLSDGDLRRLFFWNVDRAHARVHAWTSWHAGEKKMTTTWGPFTPNFACIPPFQLRLYSVYTRKIQCNNQLLHLHHLVLPAVYQALIAPVY